MKKVLYSVFLIALVLSLAGCASLKDESLSTITVSGSAEIKLSADIATFTISAESIQPKTDLARAETSSMINQAVDILSGEYGIDKKDISTNVISVSPYYTWKDNERVLSGQRGYQSIDVTLRDLSKYGAIFESLTKIDGISVSTAVLDRSDKNEGIEKVRRLAVENALKKASAYAEAAGVRIDGIVSISDGSNPTSYTYPRMLAASAKAEGFANDSTAYYAEDIKVSDSVTIVYKITK